MKLVCQVEVVNRHHCNVNIGSNKKYSKSTLALGKEPKRDKDFFLIHFSSVNKSGNKYKIKNIKQVFVKCLNEGKATLRFEEPPHDLCIKSEVIQLKCFLRLLKTCITGDKDAQLSNLSNLSVVSSDIAPVKMTIQSRSDIPIKGFPRTLEYLSMTDLKLCNFRRDILLLSHLLILDLSNNEIEKLPLEFGRMKNLRELYLSKNALGKNGDMDWRWLFGPQIIKTLKLLDISNNKIKYIPKAIWKLEKLVTLKINDNEIVKVPATIGRIQTLRYLDISKNQLETLPCSLMQCRLEHLDLSSNNFHLVTDVRNQKNTTSNGWELYIYSLTNLASKAVLKNKLFYAPNIIPWTLAEFLDNAKMCVCGNPVVNNEYIIREFDPKDYFRVVVFDYNRSVKFECYFCSSKCYIKYC
ncbi:PREDICTED: leucine-rich repeat protein 1-like isoform X1 [Papilio xuthus]|uniref:Leucine-rich repeat protein 1-like isoform X1 n=2 Tax=Papilio xuthus TaxID=66420 RepID=A0AAJ7EAZ3_PAPXU|nr:PREDICTED: leucine-rich repeat protein 1-like isoform X1 [Papilio xuthus]